MNPRELTIGLLNDPPESALERTQRPLRAAEGRRLRRTVRSGGMDRVSGGDRGARAQGRDGNDPSHRAVGDPLSPPVAPRHAADALGAIPWLAPVTPVTPTFGAIALLPDAAYILSGTDFEPLMA